MRTDCVVAVTLILNGMIGATILVLPIISITTGYIGIALITPIVGLITMYTALRLVQHSQLGTSIRQSIKIHFNNKQYALNIINTIVASQMLFSNGNYYRMLIQQIKIGIGVQISYAIMLLILFGLFIASLILQNFQIGQRIMAYGFLATIIFLVFMVWAQITADHSNSSIPAIGSQFSGLFTSLLYAFSFHSGIAQLLKRTTTPDQYKKSIIYAFSICIAIYLFACYGCYAIQNRQASPTNPQQFKQYFADTKWFASFVSIVYMFHFISVIPELSIALKIKILAIFNINRQLQSSIQQQGLQLCGRRLRIIKLDIAVFVFIYTFYFMFTLIQTSLSIIVKLLGATFGFTVALLIPIILNIRCQYFNKYDSILSNHQDDQSQKDATNMMPITVKCKHQFSQWYMKWLQLVFQFFIIAIGLYALIFTIYGVFSKLNQPVASPNINYKHQDGINIRDYVDDA